MATPRSGVAIRGWQAGGMVNGAMVALATPIDESGDIDEAGLERLVSHVVRAGVDGISPTGSTGEGPRLSSAQRARVAAAVRKRVPAEMPVISGLPLTNLQNAEAELEELAVAGASAALVAPPHYYPATEVDLIALYEGLADRSPLPIVLYNIPVFTKVLFPSVAVAKLARHPRIIGMKDSCRDMEYLQHTLMATADVDTFDILTGSDTLLFVSLLVGAAGTIAASLNLVPEMAVSIYRDVKAGKLDAAMQTQRRLIEIVEIGRTGQPPPAGWKATLQAAGICSSRLVPPASGMARDDFELLERKLIALGVGLR